MNKILEKITKERDELSTLLEKNSIEITKLREFKLK